MQEFQYTAVDSDGRPQAGTIRAESQAQARELLAERQGWQVLQIEPVVLPGEKMSRRESDALASHLADLANSQLPLETGLRMLGEELAQESWGGARLRRQFRQLANVLEGGRSLEQALSERGASPDLIAAVRAGERSGNPGQALSQYVTYMKSLSTLRSRVTLGMVYPLLMFGISMLLFIGLMTIILPQFMNIFEGFGIELPAITGVLMSVTRFFMVHGRTFLVTCVIVLAGMWIGFQLLPAYWRRRILNRLPVVGDIFNTVAMARFTHALGFLTENDVPMPESLRLAGRSSYDATILRAAQVWADCLETGESLGQVADRLPDFPTGLFEVLPWQRNQRSLARALHAMGEMYEGRARVQTATLVALAEPVTVVTIGLLFGWTVVAIFYPLIQLMNDLS